MAFCPQCGAADQDATFCAVCGATVNGANSVPVAPAYTQAPAAAVGQYADWGTRFAAFLIDALTLFAIEVVGLVLARISPAFGLLIILVQLGMNVWYAIQVGATGASPGMRVMGLKCVNEQTGEPIGGGLGVVRAIAHFVDGLICYIGYLFPLWDAKRQTLADKIMHTVVINVPKKPFSIQPK
jgi:uncharacterized RDD family membrane protein YckC